jgi:hypothetical protein
MKWNSSAGSFTDDDAEFDAPATPAATALARAIDRP